MALYTEGHSRPIGLGAYIPELRVTSREVMQRIDSKRRFGISPDWLERTMGVRERRVAPADMDPSDMALHAAREALAASGIEASEVNVLVFAGVLRDYLEPATAHVIQHKLGAVNAVAFDVSNACHGFMNGLHLVDSLIGIGQARYGLVVTGEPAFRYTEMAIRELSETTDRPVFLKLASGLTLGDAGGAVLLGPKRSPQTGFMAFLLESKGRHYALSVCGKGGRATPLEVDMVNLVEQGRRLWIGIYAELMCRLRWEPGQIAQCVQHQATYRMLRDLAEAAGVSPEIVVNTVETMGNLVSANIPVNLYLAWRQGALKQGDKILVTGGGSGIAVSQAGLIWDAA